MISVIWPFSKLRRPPYKDHFMPFLIFKYDFWHVASCATAHVPQSWNPIFMDSSLISRSSWISATTRRILFSRFWLSVQYHGIDIADKWFHQDRTTCHTEGQNIELLAGDIWWQNQIIFLRNILHPRFTQTNQRQFNILRTIFD